MEHFPCLLFQGMKKARYHAVMATFNWSALASFIGGFNLATFQGFWDATQVLFAGDPWPRKFPAHGRGPLGNLYCGTCGDQRRMFFSEIYVGYEEFYGRHVTNAIVQKPAEIRMTDLHAIFKLACAQCDASFIALMYQGPTGNSLCLLPSTYGGLASAHSPKSAKFYCDQASRAASVGAYTAALGMLRPAVDVVLEEQGYQGRYLGDKLAALEADVDKGTGPPWIRQFNHELLVALKRLGNDAVHAKAAEISSIAEKHDEELYRNCEISIGQLLEVIYERPHKEQERLTKLKAAALPAGKR